MSQPIWKTLFSTDTLAVYVDTTGEHDPEMAVLDEYETDRRTTRYKVYRFSLEGCKLIDSGFDDGSHTLVWGHYLSTHPHPVGQYVPWFWDDLSAIASFVGRPRAEIVVDLCSGDPNRLAHAYEDIGGYDGYDNFDQYPRDLTEPAVENWPDLDGKPEVRLSVSDDDDGTVTLYCSDKEAARDHQSVFGESNWEIPDDIDEAYCSISDRVGLVAALEADGWEVDASEYGCGPDEQDFAYWEAKYQRSNGATSEKLRKILGWEDLLSVSQNRRIQDECGSLHARHTGLVETAYLKACFDAGFVLDFDEWFDAFDDSVPTGNTSVSETPHPEE